MKFSNPFKRLTKFEWSLYLVSCVVCIMAFIFSGMEDLLTLISSLVGVTALIFVAKGMVFGQILCVIFAFFYGVVSLYFKYYGEVITYLFMTMPMAIVAIVSWVKHPYKDSNVVEVSRLNKKSIIVLCFLSLIVTIIFYFILKHLGTMQLVVSTISITTSFVAASLTFLRSPYYALGYAFNDIVLIVLWILASIEKFSYLPMVLCFVMFLANDLYGFYNWKKMQKNQKVGL
jgi:nicotinamide mononucleotide transporter PnuC